jgi:hypothetical protein
MPSPEAPSQRHCEDAWRRSGPEQQRWRQYDSTHAPARVGCLETDLVNNWFVSNCHRYNDLTCDFLLSIDLDLFLIIYCGWIVTISRFITCLSRFFLFGISFRERLS